MPDFLLPDLGEGLTEAEIVTWRVAVGDTVAVDQVVVEVETAKAAVEVPVPFAGVVSALHGDAGSAVRVGAPLISVIDALEPVPVGFAEPGIVTQDEQGSGNVLIGYGTSTAPKRRAARKRYGGAHRHRPVPVISPLVRKLARDAGVDLHAVRGSGPSGLVLRRDVEQASRPAPPACAASVAGAELRVPIRGVRKAMAETMTRSRREIPEATVWVDVDATELFACRNALNAADPARPVSVLALVGRFTVLALRRYRELNARIEGDELVVPSAVHLGFAAQTERGLVVPVVHDASTLTTRELAQRMNQSIERARNGELTPADMTGGTVTVNNYGVFGVDGSAAIINHPQVAIVGIGRIVDKPWVVDGQLAVRKVTQLTLAFDHRACDGGTAGGFLRYLADCVESPLVALGDV